MHAGAGWVKLGTERAQDKNFLCGQLNVDSMHAKVT